MNHVESKKVSTPLAIGILIIPIVFAWFTLRQGYSTLSRVISFGWLLAGLVTFALLPNPTVTTDTIPDDAVKVTVDERSIVFEPTDPKPKNIGTWNADWGYQYQVVYEESDGKIFSYEIYDGKATPTEEMLLVEIDGRQVYQSDTSKDHGEFYIINKNGDLEFWSKNGNYYTAKKVA